MATLPYEGLGNLATVFGGGILGLLAGSFDRDTKRIEWKDFLRGLFLLPITLVPIFSILNTEVNPIYTALIAFQLGFFTKFFLKGNRDKAELQAVRKVERAEAAVEEAPEKARPLWELSSARLELYFERNLSQIRSMFWITVGVLLVGFCLIAYGVSRAFQGAAIQAATLTAASGVLTEFIAATFLVVYKSTLTQASGFVEALERINAVGMALQIVDTLPESENKLKNESKAALSAKLLEVFGRPQNPPDKKSA
jgi:hypothetical protein